jgi:hypothetical protein
MVSTTIGSISDTPLTDELVALSEVQRADDFRSTTISRSTSSALSRSDQNIDWTRLYSYIATLRLAKRPKSFIWLYGYKIKDMRTNLEYWLCKIYYKQQLYAREPTGYIYRYDSTTTTIGYIEKKHRINQYGSMPIESYINTQRTIDSFDSLIRE